LFWYLLSSAISLTQEVGDGKVENNIASQKVGKRSKIQNEKQTPG
jgi:hypothetical protein